MDEILPEEPGSIGVITGFKDDVILVHWQDGQDIGLIVGLDRFLAEEIE